jgi:hypothetical protein
MKRWASLVVAATAWLAAAAWPGAATAAIQVDSMRQLQLLDRGVQPPLLIGDARFRVAVFAFDDPDKLAIGEALATLAMHEVLVGARVSSLGVLRFSDPMAGPTNAGLGYFDRIDLLADSQKVTVSLWGSVRRQGGQIAVDTYLQIPEPTVKLALQVRLALPRAMGGQPILARIGTDRVLLQRRLLPLDAADGIRRAASRLGELRNAPGDQAPVVRQVPLETVFYLKELRPPWVLVGSPQGGGWVRSAGHCVDACAPLLDPARFVSSLLAFIEKRRPLETRPTLGAEAAMFADQTRALAVLGDPNVDDGGRAAAELLARWSPDKSNIGADPPPGGAASANLRLVARVSGALAGEARRRGSDDYDALRLDPLAVRGFALEAAEALQADPRHAELLHNLAVMFDYLQEPTRAAYARKLLDDAVGAGRLPLLPAGAINR